MTNTYDNLILRGDEDDLILDAEVAGVEEVPNRSLRAKEDEEMVIRPLLNLRYEGIVRLEFGRLSIFALVCLCFYFEIHVVLFVTYDYFCQTLTLGKGDGVLL
ncbi:unnamed protein product [Cuscuta epithymum]|uniref:Uncharacterized protein n=1 Tax=Cuscuta epithymum TaxID=186058 RepID=A0AAV0GFC7_9ASTE|nr:unnamed protein product [Cuscuta epithymum]